MTNGAMTRAMTNAASAARVAGVAKPATMTMGRVTAAATEGEENDGKCREFLHSRRVARGGRADGGDGSGF